MVMITCIWMHTYMPKVSSERLLGNSGDQGLDGVENVDQWSLGIIVTRDWSLGKKNGNHGLVIGKQWWWSGICHLGNNGDLGLVTGKQWGSGIGHWEKLVSGNGHWETMKIRDWLLEKKVDQWLVVGNIGLCKHSTVTRKRLMIIWANLLSQLV